MEFHSNRRVLCVDPGTKRWGIAVGDSVIGTAKPLTTIAKAFPDAIAEIIKLASKEKVDCILIGRPVHMDGTESGITKLSDRAIEALQQSRFPVLTCDERLTSFSAEQSLKSNGTKFSNNKALVDRVAAALMLEAAFREDLFKDIPL